MASGTSAGPAPPGACPLACARAARRCRGSAACDRRRGDRGAPSRLRSCAGDSSLSKITGSTRASPDAAASIATLPLPRNVAGSGFARSCCTRSTASAPAADASPASSSSACSGSKCLGRIVEKSDERLRAFPYHRSDFSTRSHGTAPSLSSVTARPDASTIVEGAPPRDGPASSDRVDARQRRQHPVRRRTRPRRPTRWRWSP